MFLTATVNDVVIAFYAIIGVVVLLSLGVIVFWLNDINSRVIRNHKESLVLKRRILRNMRYYKEKVAEVVEDSFRMVEDHSNSNSEYVVTSVNRNTNQRISQVKTRLADEERDDQKAKRKARSKAKAKNKVGIVSTMPKQQVKLRDSKGRFIKTVQVG